MCPFIESYSWKICSVEIKAGKRMRWEPGIRRQEKGGRYSQEVSREKGCKS